MLHAFSLSQQGVIEEACLQAVLANGLEKDRACELVPRALKDGMAKPKPVAVTGSQAAPTPSQGLPAVYQASTDPGDTWEVLNANADAEEAELACARVLPFPGIVLAIGEQKSGKTCGQAFSLDWCFKGHGVSYAMQESAQSIGLG